MLVERFKSGSSLVSPLWAKFSPLPGSNLKCVRSASGPELPTSAVPCPPYLLAELASFATFHLKMQARKNGWLM